MPAPNSKKTFSRAALARLLSRRGKKKVVFANGCFDLLHAGHIKLLEKAKSSGDILVVALNSDGSVRRLKGAGRPLVGEKQRAQALAGLEAVDFVTVFKEDTPLEAIRQLKPDILVKGADYKISDIVGAGLVKKVVRIPLVKGISTSTIVKKILDAYGRKS
ncbi:MAG: hypothetical protein A2901_09285 [Elusimicrobia bacterium RIFCSPLOWO2_01_FULL_54_10]|nr:MAG: hypothetical protein A2901_09285 [Elusimicrobia bacterium RIFCSPLOWO2_01_FULL_54_10]